MTTHRIRAKSLLGLGMAISMGAMALAQPMPPHPPGWHPPPPPRYEHVPPPPGPRYILVPGHWRWNGYRYIWVKAHYVIRRSGWRHWVDGHWAVVHGSWTWIPGHWG